MKAATIIAAALILLGVCGCSSRSGRWMTYHAERSYVSAHQCVITREVHWGSEHMWVDGEVRSDIATATHWRCDGVDNELLIVNDGTKGWRP